MIPNYFEHPSNDVRHYGFLPRRALQTAELNGLQRVAIGRQERVADAQFSSGSIVSGVFPRIITGDASGNLLISEGRIYLKGDVRSLIPTFLNINLLSRVSVGLRYRVLEVTEIDDPSIRDPAIGTENYQEAGAFREIEQIQWGFTDEDGGHDDNHTWDFFPVFIVDKGVILMPTASGVDNKTRDLLARYDRESHGNYVVKGLECSYNTKDGLNYYINVTEGSANVFGYKIERGTGTRLSLPFDYDSETNNFEPHVFTPDANNRCKLEVNRIPIATVSQILGLKQKTVNVARGAAANTSDELPDNSVAQIVSVVQGGTTFVQNTDFLVNGDNINWSPAGAEPAPGSTYSVTYRYLTEITPYHIADTYVEVAGLVSGSMVQVSYTRKLPRVDAIALNRDNAIVRVKGESRIINPTPPKLSANQLLLATVEYDWINNPIIRQVATTNVPYDQMQTALRSIENLYSLVAALNLRLNANNLDPTTKRGMFTDPFFDDDRRDQGTEQSGAIVGDALRLPITPTLHSLPNNNATLQLLPFTNDIALSQEDNSETMLINPYAAFDPLPCQITLSPAVDRWVDVVQHWQSPITLIFFFQGGGSFTSVWTQLLARTRARLPNLRQISVNFELRGFVPGESLTSLTFDGINVTPA